MIIVRIMPYAGLGNQMFMYAAGLSAATRLNTELRLGAWNFNVYSSLDRPYSLSCFPAITEENATFSETWRISPKIAMIMFISGKKRIRRRYIFRFLLREAVRKFVSNEGIYSPRYYSYSPEFESISDNTYISGFWESEKIFSGIKDKIRTKFTFGQEYFDPQLSAKIRGCNSVAFHVRRGDKTNSQGFFASDCHYLKDAMTRILSLTDKPEFFVFSDDIEWCKINLPQIYDTEYTYIEGQTPTQDMALMTQCRHVIISPSTFSWWGAWLNNNPGKIIIAPDINLWYWNGTYDPDDRKHLLPPEWIKIR